MIWIQFSSASDASASIAFVGADEEVLIRVLSDPHVEGITVAGRVVCPDDSEELLDFDESDTAVFTPRKGEGKYTVKAVVTKEGYQDTALSARFYHMYAEPEITKLTGAV